jgi:hypothetical protein
MKIKFLVRSLIISAILGYLSISVASGGEKKYYDGQREEYFTIITADNDIPLASGRVIKAGTEILKVDSPDDESYYIFNKTPEANCILTDKDFEGIGGVDFGGWIKTKKILDKDSQGNLYEIVEALVEKTRENKTFYFEVSALYKN